MAYDENWKDVVGYEGVYAISSRGNVRALAVTSHARKRDGYLKSSFDRAGYKRVELIKDGKRRGRLIHQLVAEAFLGPRPDGQVINHKDRDKANNHVSNIEWCTYSENTRHWRALQPGFKIMPCPVEQLCPTTKTPLAVFPHIKAAAQSVGVSCTSISLAISRGVKSAGHYWQKQAA